MKKLLFFILFISISVFSENLFEYEGYSAGDEAFPPNCGTYGHLLPGQNVNLKIELCNITENTITGISGTLTLLNSETINGNPLILFYDNTDTWQDIGLDDSKCNSNGFVFQVNRDIPCHYRLKFKLEMTTDQGEDLLLFSIPVGKIRSFPNSDQEDHQLTADPYKSQNPSIALGPNIYGVVWEDNFAGQGIYFSAYDRFFEQKVGPRKIKGDAFNPFLIYNHWIDKFICAYKKNENENENIYITTINRKGETQGSDHYFIDEGNLHRMVWAPTRYKIGMLLIKNNSLYLLEIDDDIPFQITHTSALIDTNVQNFDIKFDYTYDQYFIAYQKLEEGINNVYYGIYKVDESGGLFFNECQWGTCKIENAKNPKVAVKLEPEPVHYGIVWEDDNTPEFCTSQTHEVHLAIIEMAMEEERREYLYEKYNVNISNAGIYNNGAYNPFISYSESANRWIVHWLQDTCDKDASGFYFEAIYFRSINAENFNDISEEHIISNKLLRTIESNSFDGSFDSERSYFVWSDKRLSPHSENSEIFANHSFSSHPYAFAPSKNEILLSDINFGAKDINISSDGENFFVSFIKNDPSNYALQFSLLNENMEIVNYKEKVHITEEPGAQFHKVLWNNQEDNYWVIWDTAPLIYENNNNTQIPDGGYVSIPITIEGWYTIGKLLVYVEIEHPEDGDLTISLIGPNSQEIILSSNNGMGGSNYFTYFDDYALTSITSGSPPFNGFYQPEEALSNFVGIFIEGTWYLKISDNTTNNLSGEVKKWMMLIEVDSPKGFYMAKYDNLGTMVEMPTQILENSDTYFGLFDVSLKEDGSIFGMVSNNGTKQELQFFSYPSGTPNPVKITDNLDQIEEVEIVYNDSQYKSGWGICWSNKNDGKVYFAILDDYGNFIVSPFEVDQAEIPPKVALVWGGKYYFVVYTYDHLIIKAKIIDPNECNSISCPFKAEEYGKNIGENSLDAFFTGTEIFLYWSKAGDEMGYSFRIYDIDGPLTENIDIYSKDCEIRNKKIFSMANNHKKILTAYSKGANLNSSVIYSRILDIPNGILQCNEIKNRPPFVEFKKNYEVSYNCTDICLVLDATNNEYLEIFTGQNSFNEGENDLGDSIVSYEWLLGATPISNEPKVQLTQAELESYGIILPGEYSVGLKVIDEGGLEYYKDTLLIIKDGQSPNSILITPNGGESIPYSPDTSNRKTYLIVWEVEENFPPLSRILLSYSTDGGLNWTCIADTENDTCNSNGLEVENTSYLWYLPTKEEAQAQGQTFPSAEGRIKIEVWDGGENKAEDTSDENFYIIQPTTTSIQTLIIWNKERIEDQYPGSSEGLENKLSELARHTKVNGFLLNLASVPSIQTAYTNWDGEPTNQTKANLLAEAIRNYIFDQINNTFTNTRYIIIVGDDRQIPFYRIQDNTSIYPESRYPLEVGLNTNTTIGSALNQGYFLTDNFYGELEPETIEDFTIYLNDFSVGRLVETPEQIIGVINSYLAADGQVNLKSSSDKVLITGLDFIYDSAYDIKERFFSAGKTVDCLIDNPEGETEDFCIDKQYSPTDLENQLFNSTPIHQLSNINTHANHYNFATSTGNLSTMVMDLNSKKLSRTILYTSGCHSGLPVPEIDPNNLDLPELMSKKEVLAYIGNTGYGWGMRYGKGLTEKLMEKITEKILSKDSIKIGEALSEAKRSYYLEEKRYDVFDEKAIHELTLFGIPNTLIVNKIAGYKGEEELPPPDGPDEACVKGICMKKELKTEKENFALPPGVTELQLNFTFGEGTYQAVTTPDGKYYKLNGQASGEVGDAIQPHFKYNSYLSGTNAHGIIFVGGAYENETPFDPVIAVPRSTNIDNGEGPLPGSNIFVPGVRTSFGVSTPSTLRGIGQVGYTNMLVHTGYYNSSTNVESKFNDMQFTIYYSNSSDITAPTITDPGINGFHTQEGLKANFTAQVSDISGVYRVIITYNDIRTNTWKSFDLQSTTGNNWSGSINLKGNITYYLQAIDKAGNVGIISISGPDLDGNNIPYGSNWSGPKTWDINLLDTDSDQMPDAYEEEYYCLNKNLNDAGQDPDYDYLTNIEEFAQDTNPCSGDTDGGGDNDGSEKNNGRNNLKKEDDKHITIMVTKEGATYTIRWDDSYGENSQIDGYYFVYRSSDPFFSSEEKISGAIPNGTSLYNDTAPSCDPCYYNVWNYQIETQPPNPEAVVPSTGPTTGGTQVSIYGRNFQSGAKVYFDNILATDITFVSEYLINCKTPAHSVGAVDVKVVNPNGQYGIITNGFTYY